MTKSKKPVVTFWRVVGVFGFISTVSFVGGVWLTVAAALERPVVAIDYGEEIEELSRSYQVGAEREPNRYDEVGELLSRFFEMTEEVYGESHVPLHILFAPEPTEVELRTAEFFGHTPREEQVAGVIAYLDALNASAFYEDAARLGSYRRSVREMPSGSQAALFFSPSAMDRTTGLRELCRVASVELGRRLGRGEARGVSGLLELEFACARLSSSEPFLISGLSSVSLASRAHNDARRSVLEGAVDFGEVERIAREQRPLPFAFALETERMFLLDVIQRVFSDDGDGDGFLLMGELSQFGSGPMGVGTGATVPRTRMLNVAGRAFPSRRETVSVIDRFFDAAIALSKEEAGAEQKLSDAAAEIELFSEKNRVLGMLFPSLERASRVGVHVLRERDATRVVIELERWRIAEGVYPATLDGLGAPRALIYRVDEGGASYTLYAVGEDGIDDGGDAELDRVYVPVEVR